MSDTPQRAEAPPLAWREALAALAILLVLTLALHSLAFSGYFLLDDWINVGWLPEGKHVGHLFVGNWIDGGHPPDSGALYRPIPRLSFLLDRAIWGLERPWGFHLTNLILHGLSIFFLWGIARSLWRNRWVAWGAALLFWAHPLTVEPAQWISARTDLWAAVFSLPAIWLTIALTGALTGEGRAGFPRARFGSLPLMGLALCSKETAAVLPALLLFIDLLRQRRWSRARVIWWVATLGLWACYFILRRAIFGEFLGYGMSERYMSLAGYGRAVRQAAIVCFFHPLFLMLLAVACGAILWRREDRARFAILAVWFLLSMAPLTALGFSWSENTRLLYPATAVLCLLVAGPLVWVDREPRAKGLALLMVIPIISLLALFTGVDTFNWRDASQTAREIIQVIVDDLAENPAREFVLIEQPPERTSHVLIFRSIDLPIAVSTLLDDRGIDHPEILPRLLLETSADDQSLMRPLGSDEEFRLPGAIVEFDLREEGKSQTVVFGLWTTVMRRDPSTGYREPLSDEIHFSLIGPIPVP
jgi:hypothetical protein